MWTTAPLDWRISGIVAFGDQERASQVDGNDFVPQGFARRLDRSVALDAGVVRQHIEAPHSGGALCCSSAILAPGDRTHHDFDPGQWGELFCSVGQSDGV